MKYFLPVLVALFALPLTAQIKAGTITYNEHTEFDLGDRVSAERRKQLEARMAEGAWDRKGQLTFGPTNFSYQQLPPEEKQTRGRGGWRTSRNSENPEIFYIDMIDSTSTNRRRVMDRNFIVADTWNVPDWNIANRKIGMSELPLPTQLATAIMENNDTLTAYFTPSIPLSIGPRGYAGLPGAILYLKVQNEGRFTEYKMTTMQPAAATNPEKPAGDEVITREKYEAEMKRARKMAERRRRNWNRG